MISANYFGGLELTDSVNLTTTSLTDIHEATSNTEICAGFCIVNEHTSAIVVSVYRYDGSTDVLYWEKSIPAGDTVIESDIPRWLREGYKIKAQAATANHITITPTIFKVATNEAYNR
jgi:hypothetical protein